MVDQQFGGTWTDDKLVRLRKYLSAYTKIMKNTNFKFAYIDAFAGTGYRVIANHETKQASLFPEIIDKDMEEYAEGSARIALQVQPEFSTYIFIEKEIERFDQLAILKEEFPEKEKKIILVNEDANSYLINLCRNHNWKKHRAVLFLDPFGMQVTWETIESIRLKEIFPGVAGNPKLLRNTKNNPIFLLCFASGNKRGSETAIKIAQDILKR